MVFCERMTPSILMQEGRHSADLEATSERLVSEGAYKRQRIVTIVPAIAPIPAQVYLSHVNLIYPPNQGVCRMMALGMEVGAAYSATLEQILAHPDLKDFEYLLTLETDNLPPQDGVIKLVSRMENHPEFSCISGLYFTKGEGGVAQIWGDPKDPLPNFRPQVPVPGELVECCGTGMGFALWRLSMFKDERLKRPWFETYNGTQGKGVGTQDLTFWSDARKFGYRCAVDCSVKVGHLDSNGIIW